MNRLRRFDGLVREGKSLEEALEFANYIFWSGLVDLLKQHTQNPPFECNGANLQKACELLQRDVRDNYRVHGRVEPRVKLSELEKITDQLELLSAQVAKLSSPVNETATVGDEPALHVIQGGAN